MLFTPALVFVVSRKDSIQKTLSKSNSPSMWVETISRGWVALQRAVVRVLPLLSNSSMHKWNCKQGAQKNTFKTPDTNRLTHKATDSTKISAWGRLSYSYRKTGGRWFSEGNGQRWCVGTDHRKSDTIWYENTNSSSQDKNETEQMFIYLYWL
jgi:hypothetical protein